MILLLITGIINLFNLNPMQPALNPDKIALDELNLVLTKSQKFVKVHAAEYLIWTGHREAVLKEFLNEERVYSNEPKYRIVIWRVLVQAETDTARKKLWLKNIYRAYEDLDGPDRTHATETLAKLKQPVAKLFPEVTEKTLAAGDRYLQMYALWASSYGSKNRTDINREKFLNMVLTDPDPVVRKISAFILRQLKGLNLNQWERLTEVALSKDETDEAYVTFLAASLVTAPANADHEKLLKVKELMCSGMKHYSAGQRIELAQALAEKGEKKQLGVLMDILNNKSSEGVYDPKSEEGADVRAAAAYAVLRINNR